MTDKMEQELEKFAGSVIDKLPDDRLQIDIDMILSIIDAIMAIVEDCSLRTKRAYHRGVANGRWFWTLRANQMVRKYGDCDSDVAAAVVEAFGELDRKTVDQL